MKGRESGMPAETSWNTFFAADEAIALVFGPTAIRGDCIEFGCGCGTFTLLPISFRPAGQALILITWEIIHEGSAYF